MNKMKYTHTDAGENEQQSRREKRNKERGKGGGVEREKKVSKQTIESSYRAVV